MKFFLNSAVALGIAITGFGAMAAPAEAQYYGHRDGVRDSGRGDRDSRWNRDRRGDNRREWRGRGHYGASRGGYRRHCRTEWRRGYYGHQRVRVRICR